MLRVYFRVMLGVPVLRELLPFDNFETLDTEEGAREDLVIIVVVAWPGLY